ncbi:MAG: hypothetical protein A4E40_00182 [Methanoregulaceae archaeon PtaU1.Bin059]|nr:MAG: hypothetical protein A4E39_00947 [Methanoregulaceae archaeon PtaB.Bin152]OPY43257.1 MAG: hypothetical protein A4E40_00182 [Methanoregulaceae archaeon PtaU1.Bin059]
MYPFFIAGARGVCGKEAAGRIIPRKVTWFLHAVLITIGILAGAAVSCNEEEGGPGSTATQPSCIPLPMEPSLFFCPDR